MFAIGPTRRGELVPMLVIVIAALIKRAITSSPQDESVRLADTSTSTITIADAELHSSTALASFPRDA